MGCLTMSIFSDEAVLFDDVYVKGAIEALLFASGEAVEISRLASVIGISVSDVERFVEGMIAEYGKRGIEIIRVGTKCQMRTNPSFYNVVNTLMKLPEKKVLTQVLLETLAIVAYRQPVTKGQIEEIRGLSADHAVNRLLELDLVRECGRMDAPGRPILFETTDEFLRRFNISNLNELHSIDIMTKME